MYCRKNGRQIFGAISFTSGPYWTAEKNMQSTLNRKTLFVNIIISFQHNKRAATVQCSIPGTKCLLPVICEMCRAAYIIIYACEYVIYARVIYACEYNPQLIFYLWFGFCLRYFIDKKPCPEPPRLLDIIFSAEMAELRVWVWGRLILPEIVSYKLCINNSMHEISILL